MLKLREPDMIDRKAASSARNAFALPGTPVGQQIEKETVGGKSASKGAKPQAPRFELPAMQSGMRPAASRVAGPKEPQKR
jgi:hypothetical protein